MQILALEAYDGGSHKQFLDGLIDHSNHQFTRLGLPARKWKWRMRGAAIYFAQQLEMMLANNELEGESVDVIFFSSMLSGADLRALLPKALRDKPMVCYFHENQLTYPLADESQRDYQYGFTQVTSCLAAEAVWFNSQYHLNSFTEGVEKLLKKMPDFVPEGIAKKIIHKSTVLPLGLNADVFRIDTQQKKKRSRPPTILWNHRWEYDKNPDDFFEMLFDLDRAEIDFRLIVLGEQFRTGPAIFEAAEKRLANKIIHFGYAPDRQCYVELLSQSDIVVSTAYHEFYGLAVLEAIAAGCTPLLPNRLSYPELLPTETHQFCLYDSIEQCREMLSQWCQENVIPLPEVLSHRVTGLGWPHLIGQFDEAFDQMLNC